MNILKVFNSFFWLIDFEIHLRLLHIHNKFLVPTLFDPFYNRVKLFLKQILFPISSISPHNQPSLRLQ